MLIGYARVSSSTDRQSLDLQMDALRAAGVDERHLFTDKSSGSKTSRPGLIAALADLRKDDTFIVWKLDRLGRSLTHLVTVLHDFHAREVQFRSLTEQLDTTTPQGQLLFGIMAALAEFERALITERVQAGLAAARARGRRGGRPRAIAPDTWEAITHALAVGTPKAAICRTFHVKRATLYDMMRRAGLSG